MSLEQKIEALLTPPLTELGLAIVRVQISGSQRKVLEIMIERLDGEAVKMKDCVKASRETSAFLDVDDPIQGAYSLEVTSPGLDRPLVKKADYKRFEGCEIKLETFVAKKDKKRFSGILSQVDDDKFVLSIEEPTGRHDIDFEYSEIKKAKLVPDLDF
jgi:ribosome maturation factor RimP